MLRSLHRRRAREADPSNPKYLPMTEVRYVSPVELFIYVNKWVPCKRNESDIKELEALSRELENTPPCFRTKLEMVIGWQHHVEHRMSPWEDEDRVWYGDGTYVEKQFLSLNLKSNEWQLKREYAHPLFVQFNADLHQNKANTD